MPIRTLPPMLVNQIAAGEVVERPASVVKELVENSLDALAKRIDIHIEDGGKQLIRISDDGHGVPPEELPLAVAPHATSKLNAPEQLANINTLGFRGEALASIGSICRLQITSRHTTDTGTAESGYRVTIANDHADQNPNPATPQPAACAPGTVVEAQDLFFNTPARRKFLRAAQVEFGHINEWVTRTAMTHPDVAFRLTHNNRTVLDAPAAESPRDRCVQILGHDLDQALLEFEATEPPNPKSPHNEQPLSVWGLAGLPDIARATGKFQYIYVNGRPIRDRTLTHAIREAYRGLIPTDQHPVAVVQLHIDPAAVDVNVHPAKTEVRFRDSGRLHRLVLTALRQRLLSTDLTPTATINDHPPTPRPDVVVPTRPPATTGPTSTPSTPTQTTTDFVDYFKRADPTQKGFNYTQVKTALDQQPAATTAPAPNGIPVALSDQGETSGGEKLLDSPTPKPSILQVHNSYLVTQDEQGLLIVDQHALHERVMFEQLRQRVLTNNLESQRLLTPAILPASPTRLACLEDASSLFTRIGIEAAPIGPDSLGIHGFPSFLFDRNVDPAEFVEQLLDQIEEGAIRPSQETEGDTNENNTADELALPESALHKALDMMSCKAAVKAGEHMTQPELASLLEQREQVDRSAACPHGRPTTKRVTIKDLEKWFNRV